MFDALLMIVYFSIAFASVVVACVFASVCFRVWRAKYRPAAGRSGLYVFHNGRRTCYMDPIAIVREIETDPEFNLDLDTRLAVNGNRESMAKLVKMVSRAFCVPVFTDPSKPGLTEGEMLSLFRHFMAYLDQQKKNSQRSATSADFMAAMSLNSNDEITQPTSVST